MEIVVVLAALIVVFVAAAAAAGLVAARAVGRRDAEPPPAVVEATVEEVARRVADEQRRVAVEERDAAIKLALELLEERQQQTLARERQIVASELDQRRAAIDERLGEVTRVVDTVRETVQRIEEDRKHAFGGLERELRMLHEAQQSLRTETGNLVKALRNPSTRGRWGEMQLRRAVEMAGMVHHCDFVEQATLEGDDGRLRPDVVVRLPGAKSVVIDAKVPLHAYLEAIECTDETAQAARLRDHARQVRTHIDALASKAYWSQLPESPDFVVMFVPGDPLLAAALEHDPTLMEHGAASHVLIATPVTLIALLKSVAYGWQQESLAENARRIAEAGRVLHERLGTFAGHLRKVGTNLDRAVNAYNEAVGSYDTRLVPAARRLGELDVADTDVPGVAAVDRRARPVAGAGSEPAAIGGEVIDLTTADAAAGSNRTVDTADETSSRLALEA